MSARTPVLTGVRFSKLVVQGLAAPGKHGISRWLCLCDCGNTAIANAANIKRGNTKSCGCLTKAVVRARHPTVTDILPGNRFTRLTVQGLAPSAGKRGAYWRCVCDCGAVKVVSAGSLRRGCTKSCGCFTKDRMRAARTTHGQSDRAEFNTWMGMRKRCHSPGYKDYEKWGGRGIVVCERWRNDFAAFMADMGPKPSPKHSIDRIDNDGNYEPGNCRWATPIQQARNTRTTRFQIGDQTKSLKEWCEIYGMNYAAVKSRLQGGMPLVEALTLPLRQDRPILWPRRGRRGWAEYCRNRIV